MIGKNIMIDIIDYPKPCLDYKQARKDVMTLYKKYLA